MFHQRFIRKGYKYTNTRRYLRLPAAWPIKCEPQAEAGEKQVTQTQDVSAGGVAVVVKEMVPAGSRLRLEIHCPPLNRTIQAVGKVVRCIPQQRNAGFALGIQFEQIDPKDRADLNEAIERFYGPEERERERGFWWRKLR